MRSKIKDYLRKAGRCIMAHKLEMVQLGIIGAIVLTGDTSFANTSDGGDLSVVVSPLKKVQEAISGPIATTVGTAGAGLLGLSVAMNFENSVAKRAIQGPVVSASALAGPPPFPLLALGCFSCNKP